MKVARSCLREHSYRYLQGYRPLEEGFSLTFGTVLHAGLEAWWRVTDARESVRLELALAALRAAAVGKLDAFALVRAEVMLSAYHLRWEPEAEHYQVLAVEAEFRTALRNPDTGATSRTWELAGKLDGLVRDRRDGRVLVLEHKTSSEDVSPGSEYWQRLRMDSQVSTYFAGAKALGHEASACLYDVLSIPGLKPLKATPVEKRKYTAKGALYAAQREVDETPDEYRNRLLEAYIEEPTRYFARGEVQRLEAQLEEAERDAWAMGRMLREAELEERAPRNPDVCLRFGRRCPFFAVCAGEGSLDDTRFFTRTTSVHPELGLASNAQHPAEEAGFPWQTQS
jgi:hypothetical protein